VRGLERNNVPWRIKVRKGWRVRQMYGTVARMRPKTGHEQAILEINQQWQRDRKPKVKGAVGAYVLRPDNKTDEMVLIAIFEDRQTYRLNAEDPDQDRWFRQLREHLEGDPQWEDGEIIFSS